MNSQDLGRRIKSFRERAGLSQFQLELVGDFASGSISRIESGVTNPTKETISKIAEILKLNDIEKASLHGIELDKKILSNFDTVLSFDKTLIGDNNIDLNLIKDKLGLGISEYDISVDDGAKSVIEACQRTIDGDDKEIYFISNMNEWRRVFTEEHSKRNYIPERIRKQIYLKTLVMRDFEAQKAKSEDSKLFREYRYLSNDFKFIHTIAFTKDKFYIYECRPPYRTVLITNENLTQVFHTFFDNMWRLSSSN